MNPIQVVAVTGGKGGIGKTNTSVNLAIALARRGRRVALLDADLGLANVDVMLGLKPQKTLADLLSGEAEIIDVLMEGPAGIRIVPAASGAQDMTRLSTAEHAGLISSFNSIAHQIDVLLIDTAAGISSEVTTFLCAAQEVLVVVCDEPTALTDAYALIKVLNQNYGVDRVRILVNMVRSDEDGKRTFAKLENVCDRFLNTSLLYAGAIPFDDYVRRAVQKQQAVVDAYPTAKASMAYMELAEVVSTWPIPARVSGNLQFFIEQLAQDHRVQ